MAAIVNLNDMNGLGGGCSISDNEEEESSSCCKKESSPLCMSSSSNPSRRMVSRSSSAHNIILNQAHPFNFNRSRSMRHLGGVVPPKTKRASTSDIGRLVVPKTKRASTSDIGRHVTRSNSSSNLLQQRFHLVRSLSMKSVKREGSSSSANNSDSESDSDTETAEIMMGLSKVACFSGVEKEEEEEGKSDRRKKLLMMSGILSDRYLPQQTKSSSSSDKSDEEANGDGQTNGESTNTGKVDFSIHGMIQNKKGSNNNKNNNAVGGSNSSSSNPQHKKVQCDKKITLHKENDDGGAVGETVVLYDNTISRSQQQQVLTNGISKALLDEDNKRAELTSKQSRLIGLDTKRKNRLSPNSSGSGDSAGEMSVVKNTTTMDLATAALKSKNQQNHNSQMVRSHSLRRLLQREESSSDIHIIKCSKKLQRRSYIETGVSKNETPIASDELRKHNKTDQHDKNNKKGSPDSNMDRTKSIKKDDDDDDDDDSLRHSQRDLISVASASIGNLQAQLLSATKDVVEREERNLPWTISRDDLKCSMSTYNPGDDDDDDVDSEISCSTFDNDFHTSRSLDVDEVFGLNKNNNGDKDEQTSISSTGSRKSHKKLSSNQSNTSEAITNRRGSSGQTNSSSNNGGNDNTTKELEIALRTNPFEVKKQNTDTSCSSSVRSTNRTTAAGGGGLDSSLHARNMSKSASCAMRRRRLQLSKSGSLKNLMNAYNDSMKLQKHSEHSTTNDEEESQSKDCFNNKMSDVKGGSSSRGSLLSAEGDAGGRIKLLSSRSRSRSMRHLGYNHKEDGAIGSKEVPGGDHLPMSLQFPSSRAMRRSSLQKKQQQQQAKIAAKCASSGLGASEDETTTSTTVGTDLSEESTSIKDNDLDLLDDQSGSDLLSQVMNGAAVKTESNNNNKDSNIKNERKDDNDNKGGNNSRSKANFQFPRSRSSRQLQLNFNNEDGVVKATTQKNSQTYQDFYKAMDNGRIVPMPTLARARTDGCLARSQSMKQLNVTRKGETGRDVKKSPCQVTDSNIGKANFQFSRGSSRPRRPSRKGSWYEKSTEKLAAALMDLDDDDDSHDGESPCQVTDSNIGKANFQFPQGSSRPRRPSRKGSWYEKSTEKLAAALMDLDDDDDDSHDGGCLTSLMTDNGRRSKAEGCNGRRGMFSRSRSTSKLQLGDGQQNQQQQQQPPSRRSSYSSSNKTIVAMNSSLSNSVRRRTVRNRPGAPGVTRSISGNLPIHRSIPGRSRSSRKLNINPNDDDDDDDERTTSSSLPRSRTDGSLCRPSSQLSSAGGSTRNLMAGHQYAPHPPRRSRSSKQLMSSLFVDEDTTKNSVFRKRSSFTSKGSDISQLSRREKMLMMSGILSQRHLSKMTCDEIQSISPQLPPPLPSRIVTRNMPARKDRNDNHIVL